MRAVGGEFGKVWRFGASFGASSGSRRRGKSVSGKVESAVQHGIGQIGHRSRQMKPLKSEVENQQRPRSKLLLFIASRSAFFPRPTNAS